MKPGAGTVRRQAGKAVAQQREAQADEPAAIRARILGVIRKIPRGQVMGYGEVAAKAGLPGRARLVARLLADNHDPALPWHRVLRSDGRIAFAQGSRGFDEQCRRLRAEGVEVRDGRVRRGPRADDGHDLDAALWGPGG